MPALFHPREGVGEHLQTEERCNRVDHVEVKLTVIFPVEIVGVVGCGLAAELSVTAFAGMNKGESGGNGGTEFAATSEDAVEFDHVATGRCSVVVGVMIHCFLCLGLLSLGPVFAHVDVVGLAVVLFPCFGLGLAFGLVPLVEAFLGLFLGGGVHVL